MLVWIGEPKLVYIFLSLAGSQTKQTPDLGSIPAEASTATHRFFNYISFSERLGNDFDWKNSSPSQDGTPYRQQEDPSRFNFGTLGLFGDVKRLSVTVRSKVPHPGLFFEWPAGEFLRCWYVFATWQGNPGLMDQASINLSVLDFAPDLEWTQRVPWYKRFPHKPTSL